MKEKISSNEYSSFTFAVFANIGVLLITYVGLSSKTTNIFILLATLFVVEISFILIAKKIIKRLSLKVFIVDNELHVIKYNYSYTIPIMKIRKVKLKHGNAGNSRPYRIEYLDDDHELNSLSFYVARWNTKFEKFIAFVEGKNPYAKIERYSMPQEK